jgi:DNA-binding NtrC family response regulator
VSDQDRDKPGILFVDDDVSLTEKFHELYRDEFKVFIANTAGDALDYIGRRNIGVVISDHYMPSLTGVELLKRVHAKKPLIRRILISGQMDVHIAMEAKEKSEVHKIFVKPFNPNLLRIELRIQLKQYISDIHQNS